MTGAEHALNRLLLEEALVVAVALLLLGGLTTALVRVEFRPLNAIADTAGAIAAGDLDRRVTVTGPRTEVGRLGLALNGMLWRLERAFAETEASEERLSADGDCNERQVTLEDASAFRVGDGIAVRDTQSASGDSPRRALRARGSADAPN